jgi:hypothetical protein
MFKNSSRLNPENKVADAENSDDNVDNNRA